MVRDPGGTRRGSRCGNRGPGDADRGPGDADRGPGDAEHGTRIADPGAQWRLRCPVAFRMPNDPRGDPSVTHRRAARRRRQGDPLTTTHQLRQGDPLTTTHQLRQGDPQ
jgi:hypothetical protein